MKDYPSLERIANLYPGPQILLGQEIHWTEKRDGSQMRISLVDGNPQVSTHHQDEASEQFRNYFLSTDQAENVIALLKEHNGFAESPASDFNIGAVVFGEILIKGRSPARFELHDKHEFIIFDIWSEKQERFLSYTAMYQTAYHFGLPVVECWALTRHTTMESLYAMRDEMLIKAKEAGREGVVLKVYGKQIFAKEKLDTPNIPRIQLDDGAVHLPSLPDSEAYGAVAKAHADLGEGFRDKSKAMPLVARYIQEEMGKHLGGKPAFNFFYYYQQYLGGVGQNRESSI